jgi:UDPglucose 6-dehydrogenase
MMPAVPEPDSSMTVAILGMGYVGLVTAGCLALMEHRVIGIDNDHARIDALRSGQLPFHEPGLDDLVRQQQAAGRLTYSDDAAAMRGADMVLVAVGTLDRTGEWTAADVERAVAQISRDPHAPRTVAVRSTLMPGTTARMANEARDVDPDFDLAFNPEFTRQGTAVTDFLHPERVVIGSTASVPGTSNAVTALRHLYARLDAPAFVTDAASAELIKVGSNAYLSMKIGFANEMARLSAATGADPRAVVDGIGLDSRIGRGFLSPGPGYGGSCLPSQARALPRLAGARGVETPILDSIDRSNRRQAEWVADLTAAAAGDIQGAGVTVLGQTFKQGTDDVRESPAVAVVRALASRGARVTVHDPWAVDKAVRELGQLGISVESADSAVEACRDAVAIVVATEWPEYAKLDWAAVANAAAGRVVVDARQVVDVPSAQAAGFEVIVHGRRATIDAT